MKLVDNKLKEINTDYVVTRHFMQLQNVNTNKLPVPLFNRLNLHEPEFSQY